MVGFLTIPRSTEMQAINLGGMFKFAFLPENPKTTVHSSLEAWPYFGWRLCVHARSCPFPNQMDRTVLLFVFSLRVKQFPFRLHICSGARVQGKSNQYSFSHSTAVVPTVPDWHFSAVLSDDLADFAGDKVGSCQKLHRRKWNFCGKIFLEHVSKHNFSLLPQRSTKIRCWG